MPYLVGYVTPQDYGAAGNGTADDTAAVQAALTAINAAGGGTLFVPPGTYKLSSALTVYSNVTILGAGSNVSVLSQSSTTANGLSGTDIARLSLRAIKLLGPGSGSGIGVNLGLSVNAATSFLDFTDVYVFGFGSDGIRVQNPIVSTFSQVSAVSNGGYGFNLQGQVAGAAGTSCSLNACYANGNTSYGYRLYNMVYTSLQGCAADLNPTGYYLDTCQSVNMSGCGSEQNTNAVNITNSFDISVTSQWVTGNNGIGIHVTGGSQAVNISAAKDTGPQGGATAFIKVDAGCTATLTSYNNVTANSLASGTTNILNNNAGGGAATFNGYTFVGSTLEVSANILTDGGNVMVGGGTGDNGSREIQLGNALTVPTTNPTGGGAIYAVQGTPYLRDPNGAVRPLVAGPQAVAATPGSLAESIHRYAVTTSSAPVSGTLYIQQVYLPAGTTVGHVGFATGTTAASGPTHWWAALLDNTYKQQAHSADQTTGAIAASTWFNLAMATSYVTTYSGVYYLALVIATSTTQPTILQSGTAPAAQFITGTGAPTPLINGASTASLTAPGTDGTTTYAAPTAASAPFYLYCS